MFFLGLLTLQKHAVWEDIELHVSKLVKFTKLPSGCELRNRIVGLMWTIYGTPALYAFCKNTLKNIKDGF
jgi:hypothetical protein